MSSAPKAVALALALAIGGASVTGCGYGLSGPDPQRPRNEIPKCDTGKGAVVVDGVMATLASVVALALAANDEEAGALIPAGIAVAYIGGAIHGSRAVDACRAAMEEWQGDVAAREMRLDRRDARRDRDDIVGAPGSMPAMPPPQAPPRPDVSEQTPPAPAPPPPAQPPVAKQPPARKPPPQQAPQPAPSDDEWSDFWREVP